MTGISSGGAPAAGFPLMLLEDLADPGSAAALWEKPDGPAVPLLLVRRGELVRAYINSCPHLGAPLDWLPGQFLSRDKTSILCALHGASFRLEDGYCTGGPCAGKMLTAVPVTVVNDVIVIP